MVRFQRVVWRLAGAGAVLGAAGLGALVGIPKLVEIRKGSTPTYCPEAAELLKEHYYTPLPSRQDLQDRLQQEEYDILIIGGGATGTGVALDSVTRGLKTAMVEKFDFSAGTSSRSTKLIHGGVRYLQKAMLNLDIEQYKMVKEALTERANLLDIAPHLAYPLPIMLPVYKWWQLPYFWVGIKMYDLVSGTRLLKSSYVLSKSKALENFPMLKKEKLVGAIVYYDGQHDDARMCLAIALSAIRMGAACANHTECVQLLKEPKPDGSGDVVCGARVRDRVSDDWFEHPDFREWVEKVETCPKKARYKEYDVRAKCVINATGPYTDFVRQMDYPQVRKICQPSSGVHVVLPQYYSPANMGLLDPATSDGRVIFFLPWQNATVAGTTDSPCQITDNPEPKEEEIQFILKEIKNYLSPDVNVRRGDVLSAWSGIRPLVLNPAKKDTQSIARNHIIEVSDSDLITIAGGKWTTYRSMAQETVDRAIELKQFKPLRGCVTKGLTLDGGLDYTPTLFIRLIQDFGMDAQVAQHLASTYGDRAFKVGKLSNLTGKRWPIVGKRLHDEYPYIEAEVIYATREYACTAIDILARRTRLAFVNVHAAQESLPKIVDIMAHELGWSKQKKEEQFQRAMRFLRLEMGLELKDQTRNIPINFTKQEINLYSTRFRALDTDNKGYITVNDLRRYFKSVGEAVEEEKLHEMLKEVDINKNGLVDMGEFLQKDGERMTEDQLHEILSEVDLNKNAQVDLGEFLQLMSAVKTGAVSMSRLAKAAELNCERISVTRSGGGV